MEEDKQVLNYRGLSHLVERLKQYFIKNPKNRAAGKYLKCIDASGNVEWAEFPAFLVFKGTVTNYSLLPSTGNSAGDVWKVEETGAEYVWILNPAGTTYIWEYLGKLVDLTNHASITDTVTAGQVLVSKSNGSDGITYEWKTFEENTDTKADWTETDTNSAAYILNKPNLATVATSGAYSDLSGTPTLATVATSGSYTDLSNTPTIPAAQVLADWDQTIETEPDYIKNKPTISNGTVTSITAGTGLLVASGDSNPITTSGTINLKTATDSNIGGVKSSTTGNAPNRDYNVQVNQDGTMKVNVPWTDTIYSQGTGLSFSGTTINHSNSITAGTASGSTTKTLTFGDTFDIPTVTYDALGHVTNSGTTTMTMPANPNTDIKQFISTSNDKMYLTGVLDNSGVQTEAQTGVANTGVYATNGYLHLDGNIEHGLETYNITASSESKTVNIDYTSKKYILIKANLEGLITINILNSGTFTGVRELVVRVYNDSSSTNLHPAIKVTAGINVTLSNMFDAAITSESGGNFIPRGGNNLELVFTFWGVGDVTFNGGTNV